MGPCVRRDDVESNASRERDHRQKVDGFKAKLGSFDFRYLAVVLQPEFEKTVEVDQLDVNGAMAGFATRLP
ncbi:anti-sigma-K factor RskA [Bradyrhizobium sp. AZCC 2262]